MTKEQQTIFDKLFSDYKTINRFLSRKTLVPQEAKAFDDVYSIIDNVYRTCVHDAVEKDNADVLHIIRQNIKKKYNDALGLWCSGQYLETLEQWYDYILFSHWEDEND